MARPVGDLVREGGIVAFGIAERLKVWHLHIVGVDRVESPIATMPDICAGGLEKRLRLFDPLHRIKARFRLLIETFGQTLDLLNVEDGVALQKRDSAFDFIPVFVFLRPGDLVGIDHQGAPLPFANIGLQLQGLFVGHPGRGCKSLNRRG